MKNTPESLLTYMREHGHQAELQAETKQVYTILKISDREYPLFLRVFDNGHLLQLLAFVPCQWTEQVLPDLARLLHIINKELDVPGFGMDEAAGVIFYRIMIPTPKKEIEPELLGAFIKTVEQVCSMFALPIQAVAYGHTTLEEILKKAREIESEKS